MTKNAHIRSESNTPTTRQHVISGLKGYWQYHDENHNIIFTDQDIMRVSVGLNNVQAELLKAQISLPVSFSKIGGLINKLLLNLALSWGKIGDALLQNGNSSHAIRTYKKALEIYASHPFAEKHRSEEFYICNKLTDVYLQERRYPEAIKTALKALLVYPDAPKQHLLPIYADLIFAYFNTKNYSKVIAIAPLALSIYKDCPQNLESNSIYEKIKTYSIQSISEQAITLITTPALKQFGTFATSVTKQNTSMQTEESLTLT